MFKEFNVRIVFAELDIAILESALTHKQDCEANSDDKVLDLVPFEFKVVDFVHFAIKEQ